MANIELSSKPDRTTAGSIGDICTVTSTGEQYELVSIHEIKNDRKSEKTYEWKLVENESGGKNGADGVAPIVEISEIVGGHRIIITDVNGPQTVDVMDGEKGEKGDKGDTGATGAAGYTPVKGTDYFTDEEKDEMVQEVVDIINAQTAS